MGQSRLSEFRLPTRLLALFYRWAEYESCALYPTARCLPRAGYVWKRDKLGHFHHGRYDVRTGKFIPCEPAFNMIRSNVPQHFENEKIGEFGSVFRKMDELSQGLVIMDCLGGDSEWAEYLIACGLSKRRAKLVIEQVWAHLMRECRKRGLL